MRARAPTRSARCASPGPCRPPAGRRRAPPARWPAGTDGAHSRRLDVLLDRHVDEVAPLGPRAVVVLDVVAAQELVQDEPAVRRALADAAVGDDRIAGQ